MKLDLSFITSKLLNKTIPKFKSIGIGTNPKVEEQITRLSRSVKASDEALLFVRSLVARYKITSAPGAIAVLTAFTSGIIIGVALILEHRGELEENDNTKSIN